MVLGQRCQLAEVLLWLLPAFWSSNYLIARAGASLIPPHVLAFGRWGLVMIILLVWRGPSLWRHRTALKDEASQSLVFGALGMWICGAWVYIGGRSTTAANIGLIYAIVPIGIAIWGALSLGERLERRQKLSMGLALAGLVVVIFRGDPLVILDITFNTGDLWILAAAVAWVAYSLLQRAWKTRLHPADRLFASCLGGLLIMAPFAYHELVTASNTLPSNALALVVLAALLPGLASFLAYAYLQKELGVARASLVLYLSPIYGALLSWAILGENPQWYHAAGALLILPGIWYSAPSSQGELTS